MSSLQGCCTLCSILMLVGGNLGVLVEIHQESINGTEGQSVLLPVSYRFDGAPQFPMKIVWNSSNVRDELVTCSVLNCSLSARGAPSSWSALTSYHTTYRGRAKLFPKNGSLLLSDLRLRDSGVYSVTFKPPSQTWHITLTVHERRSTPEHPGTETGVGGTAARIPCYIFGGCCCFILLFLQLFFHLRWHRPNSWEASNRVSRSVPGSESWQSRLQHGAAPQPQ